MSMQQEKPQSPCDYAGRFATTEIEIRDNYSTSKLENSSDKQDIWKYNPNGVTFIQHPFTCKKLAVIHKPIIANCNVCNMDHKTIYYKLEDNYCACYCKNYREGNWVFKKN
jgi:hypothetical protein